MRPRLGSIVGSHAGVVGGVAFDGVGSRPILRVWVTPAFFEGVWSLRHRLGGIVGSHAGVFGGIAVNGDVGVGVVGVVVGSVVVRVIATWGRLGV